MKLILIRIVALVLYLVPLTICIYTVNTQTDAALKIVIWLWLLITPIYAVKFGIKTYEQIIRYRATVA
jgi:hypothetical protein